MNTELLRGFFLFCIQIDGGRGEGGGACKPLRFQIEFRKRPWSVQKEYLLRLGHCRTAGNCWTEDGERGRGSGQRRPRTGWASREWQQAAPGRCGLNVKATPSKKPKSNLQPLSSEYLSIFPFRACTTAALMRSSQVWNQKLHMDDKEHLLG